MKRCRTCFQSMPLDRFNRVNITTRACFADGYNTQCNDCSRWYQVARLGRLGHPEKVREFEIQLLREHGLREAPHIGYCFTCDKYLDVDQMLISTRNKSGRGGQCKSCHTNYYRVNPEPARVRAKTFYEENKPDILAKNRIYIQSIPIERRREWARRSYAKNREQRAAWKLKYKAENKEKFAAATRRHYLKHRDRYIAHRHKRRAISRNAQGTFTAADWQAKCRYWGQRCYLCNSSLEQVEVTIEHRIPLSRGGTNWLANVAPACLQCNLKKNRRTEKEYTASGQYRGQITL